MSERPPTQPTAEQEPKTKSFANSLSSLNDYLEKRLEEKRRRRLEGRESTVEETVADLGDIFQGFKFLKERGATLKSISKETLNGALKNPGSWEDILTQGVAKTQKTIAQHMREGLEKKLEIKADTARSLLDVEEEEQRLATTRANLEAAEALLRDRKQVLTGGREFTTIDPTGSLKNEGNQAAKRHRESGQKAADGFFKRIFGGL